MGFEREASGVSVVWRSQTDSPSIGKKVMKRQQKCKTCNGTGEVSLAGFSGYAVMPMVTCMTCDGTGKQGGEQKGHISPHRMAEGRDA